MPPKRWLVKCEICGHRTQRKDNEEKRDFMAQFPLDEVRCREWVKLVGNEDLVYIPIERLHGSKFVCGNHFDDKSFNKKKNRLKRSAVPSKNLRANPLPDEMLLEFPCHVYSDKKITQDCQGQVEAVAGPSNSESYASGHQQQFSYVSQSPSPDVEMINEPESESYASGQKQQFSYVSQSPSRNVEMINEPKSELYTSLNIPSPSQEIEIIDEFESESSSLRQPQHLQPNDTTKRQKSHTRKHKRRSEPSTSGELHIMEHNYFKKTESTSETRTRKSFSGSPRTRNLKKQLNLCRNKIKRLKKETRMPKIKSLALKTLINAYTKNYTRKPQGKRWTSLEKALAIAIYKKSPRAYRHLKHLVALPSVRTLQTLLQSIDFEPGISSAIMVHLKKNSAKLNEKDKLCALLFDEIALKRRLIFNPKTDKVEGFVDLGDKHYRCSEVANHALVFMLQGLHKKLKQPIAYYFVKGTISSQSLGVIIKDVIKAVTDIGYTIVTTVCDQGPTNMGSLKLLKEWSNIPADKNYFLINDSKIFIMFDIPHLFKSIRNNFHSGGEIVYDGKKGKWSHLVDLEAKNKSVLHFQKLTALHVNPTYRSKMKVKLAAQVLSNTVAAILKLLAESYGDNDKAREILETAHIVEDLNQLFDCTNGPASNKDVIRHKRQNVSKKTNHIELWKHFKQKLGTMHFLKADSFLRLKNVRCVQGYITSLTSLESIWRFVESKGFKYLNLRQLNQDSLENLFGMIRQHCPTNRNPTCHHFTSALKSNILTKLSTPIGRGANCEKDDNEAIIDFEDFFKNQNIHENTGASDNFSAGITFPTSLSSDVDTNDLPILHIADDDEYLSNENDFESFQQQPTVYVAGYLASVVIKKHQWICKNCKSCLKVEDPKLIESQMYSYIKLREWWQDKKSLTYPSINLCQLVDSATLCFQNDIKSIIHEKHISQQAVTVMLSKCDNLLWLCTEHKDELIRILLVSLTHLLIRNECRRVNLSFAEAEQSNADIIKKAQQQGIAK